MSTGDWIGLAGVIVALAGVVVAILIYLKQRSRKEVCYEIISDASVLSVDRQIKPQVEVRFNSVLVTNLNLVVLKLWNSGNQPIKRDDYDRPLELWFGGKAEILTAEVAEPNPTGATIQKDSNHVIITPVLLNPKEGIKLTILVTQYHGLKEVQGRIIGGSIFQISKADVGNFPSIEESLEGLGTALWGIILVTGLVYGFTSTVLHVSQQYLPYFTISTFGLVSFLVLCVYLRRLKLLERLRQRRRP
ncbi:MAG TPA: hypothetical protein VFV38_53300 [Ktedonobacteraceae bacterium]|nr:hypothetical protein [Ktedonobacteraceae bacterium]